MHVFLLIIFNIIAKDNESDFEHVRAEPYFLILFFI